MENKEYNITEEDVNNLRKYMAECIKNLNKGVRMSFRNAIFRMEVWRLNVKW